MHGSNRRHYSNAWSRYTRATGGSAASRSAYAPASRGTRSLNNNSKSLAELLGSTKPAEPTSRITFVDHRRRTTTAPSWQQHGRLVCRTPPTRAATATAAAPSRREASLAGIFIRTQVRTARSTSTTSPARALPAILRPALTDLAGIWAKRTWAERARLWNHVQEFASTNGITSLPFGAQAIAFIANNRNLQPTSRYTYAKQLRALAAALAIETPLLDLYCKGLAASGAADPEAAQQAVPATQAQVDALIDAGLTAFNGNPRIPTLLYLAFKCAARIDDLLHLTKESLLPPSDKLGANQIVIEWGRTKTNRRNERRVHSWTVVEENRIPARLRMVQQAFASLRPGEPLCMLTTQQLVRLVQRHPQCRDLTGHSFKRGAADHLFQLAASGVIEDPRLIVTLLKHQDALQDFPRTTLRYVQDKTSLALTFKSQLVTRHL